MTEARFSLNGDHPAPATRLAVALACLVLAAGTPARAQPQTEEIQGRALIIDDQLASRPIVVVSLDERLLTYVDEQQRRRTLTRANLLALIPEPVLDPVPRRNAPDSPPGILELVDGQRFPGDLLPAGGGEESIAWTHPSLGQLAFPLERALIFWRRGAPSELRHASNETPASDILLLSNGDQLAGFLASAGDPLRLEADGAVTELPPERVLGARLSNSREAAAGARLWLDDGTVARVDKVIIDSGLRASFAVENAAGGSASWPQIRAVAFDAGRVRSLSRIEPASYAPAKGRRFAPPIRPSADAVSSAAEPGITALDAEDLLLPGPMTVNWVLPEGSRRIAFVASLADGSAPWGDCDLIVSIEGTEQSRHRLSADSGEVSISLPVNGRALSITVEPGRYGPIRDWVVLSRPLILVSPGRSDSSE